MKGIINPISFLMSLLLITTNAFSQSSSAIDTNMVIKYHAPWEVGLLVGGANAYGDMVDAPFLQFSQTNLAYGAFVRHNINRNISVRLNALRGMLSGSDLNSDELSMRGYSFEAPTTEISLLGEFDLGGKRRYSDKGRYNRTISPYAFLGLGVGLTSLKADFADEEGNIAPQAQMDLNNVKETHFSVPMGLGLKVDINKQWGMSVEFGMRPVFNDYLDGLSLAGNPDKNDWYSVGGVTVSYRFGLKDTDRDGIANKQDKCPDRRGPVELMGCPDSDNDGITDAEDRCPTTAGTAATNGCPDTDEDGIADREDKCPTVGGINVTEDGCPDRDYDGVPDDEDDCPDIQGLVEFNGCRDTDKDGVRDNEDQCPYLKGVPEYYGCPVPDRDNDGVLNEKDECPDTPGSINGCPDTDKDGLIDSRDDCPDLEGPRSNNGCPELSAADKLILETAINDVKFNTASYTLLSTSYPVLDQIAELMKRYPTYHLLIEGYTDNRGNDFANQQLSQYRSQACAKYLSEEGGINMKRLHYIGRGETNPRANNDTVSGRRQNRRVEFTLAPLEELDLNTTEEEDNR
jgi:outer membrane protein OmpA-like peptidoglycan-associated protein